VNPTAVGFSASNVTATVAEWTYATKITSLFELSTIDAGLTQKSKELGYHAGLVMDTELRRVIIAGATAQYAGSKTNITAVNSTDTFSATELRIANKTLFENAAPTFENGMYRAIVTPTGRYQLNLTGWLRSNTMKIILLNCRKLLSKMRTICNETRKGTLNDYNIAPSFC